MSDSLPFYKHITPLWLLDNGSPGFSVQSGAVTETRFEIPTETGQKYQSLFQLQLLKPSVLDDADDIVVKLKIGLEYPESGGCNPMIFTIWCPGEDAAMNIQINDVSKHSTEGPFCGIRADASDKGLSSVSSDTMGGSPITNTLTLFPQIYEFTYFPNSFKQVPWSSAYCAAAYGTYGTFAPYFKSLKVSNGLNLGIYSGGDECPKEFIFKSLEIYISRNSLDAFGN